MIVPDSIIKMFSYRCFQLSRPIRIVFQTIPVHELVFLHAGYIINTTCFICVFRRMMDELPYNFNKSNFVRSLEKLT